MESIGKRITFTVTNDLVFDQRMKRICASLQAAGYQVTLVGRLRKNSRTLPPETFQQKRLTCFFDRGFLFYLEYNLRLLGYLLFKKTDILGAVDTDTLFPNTLVSLIRSRILVLDAHEYFTEVPELKGRDFTRRIWRLVERLCIPVTKLRYTVSASLANELSSVFDQPFEVIRNIPQYDPAVQINPSLTERQVFYLGDLNPGRGLEETIAAMKQVNARMLIAGDGPLRAELEAQVSRLGLTDRITFCGYQPLSAIPALLSRQTIGINVLNAESRSYYFSLANKFFNYIHFGIPQVCSPLPEYQLIQETIAVAAFSDLNPDALAQTLNGLFENPDAYAQLRDNCSKAKATFTWEQESLHLINLYAQL